MQNTLKKMSSQIEQITDAINAGVKISDPDQAMRGDFASAATLAEDKERNLLKEDPFYANVLPKWHPEYCET